MPVFFSEEILLPVLTARTESPYNLILLSILEVDAFTLNASWSKDV